MAFLEHFILHTMVLITEDLIRKRAEHNDGEIYSLEEISLHQQHIERIDHIQNWCKSLRILYLQNNLIPKIENLSKLKRLEYLNLALNNIEKIENLEGCESLKKLDLTINFVGDLMSIESLINVHFLEELYLTGNPCTEYPGYREFVVATLPQLKLLDGVEITKSERIVALQNLEKIRPIIHEKQREHKLKRKSEKADAEQRKERFNKKITSSGCADVGLEEFWSEKVLYTPESRIETYEFMQLQAKSKHESKDPGTQVKKITRYFAEDGRPYNINTAKIEFNLKEEKIDGLNYYILNVAVYKHMDTALIQCDIQVNYVRVTFKGKVLQLALPDDIQADASYVKRSTTTGHLLITMPKASQETIIPADKRHRNPQRDQDKARNHI
ncbi:Protein tilB like [Schistosoma japonicum]|nr:Protein tilB like [Schistosoma japonicum]